MVSLTDYVPPPTYLSNPSVTSEALSVAVKTTTDILSTRDQQLANAIDSEANQRLAGDIFQRDQRIAGDATNAAAIATETAARVAFDEEIAARVDRLLFFRPGDDPKSFVRAIAGVRSDIPTADVVADDNGFVVRVGGDVEIISRRRFPVELDRINQARFAIRRRTDSADPSEDAVQCILRWCDQTGTPMTGGSAEYTAGEFLNLKTTDGRQTVSVLVSHLAGSYVHPPAGARYVELVVRCHGNVPRTDVEVMSWVPAETIYAPSTAAFESRLATIESLYIDDRLVTLESRTASPSTMTFQTVADATAYAIPAYVDLVIAERRLPAGPILMIPYQRSIGEPAHALKWQDANSSWWEWAGSGEIDIQIAGADDSGSTDSAAAIQAAYLAAPYYGNAAVRWPTGGEFLVDSMPYNVNSTAIQIPSNSTTEAHGAKCIVGPNLPLTARVFSNPNIPQDRVTRTDHDIVFRGLTMDGSGREYIYWLSDPATGDPVTDPAGDPTRNPAVNTRGTLMQFFKVDRVLVEECRFIDHESITIAFNGCKSAVERNNYFENCGKPDDASYGVMHTYYGTLMYIVNCTRSAPAIITTSRNHTFTAGQTVYVSGMKGTTSIPDGEYVIQSVGSNTIALTGTDTSSDPNFSFSGAQVVSSVYMSSEDNISDGSVFRGMNNVSILDSATRTTIRNVDIDGGNEAAIHIIFSRSGRMHGCKIRNIDLYDISAHGVEIDEVVDFRAWDNDIDSVDFSCFRVNAGLGVRINRNRLRNPAKNPGVTYGYGVLSEAGGLPGNSPADGAFSWITANNIGLFPLQDFDYGKNEFIDDRRVPGAKYGVLLSQVATTLGVKKGSIEDNDFSRAGGHFPITSVSKSNPAVVSIVGEGHNLRPGDSVRISGVQHSGMIELTDGFYTVGAVNDAKTTFELTGVNSTGYSTYWRSPLAWAGHIGMDRLIGIYDETAVVQSSIVVRNNRGHTSRSPMALRRIVLDDGVTGVKRIRCGFCPSMVMAEAVVVTNVYQRLSRTAWTRYGVDQSANTLGVGLQFSIDALTSAGAHTTFNSDVSEDVISILTGAGGVAFRAEFSQWRWDGFDINVTSATGNVYLSIIAFP